MTADDRAFWLVLVALGVIPWLYLGIAHRLGFRLLPPQRTRVVPWGAIEVVLLFLGFGVLLPPAIAGFWQLVLPSGIEEDARFNLIVMVQATLITVSCVPMVMAAFHRSPLFWELTIPWRGRAVVIPIRIRGGLPYQMGLQFSHLGQNILLGMVAYLLAIPLVAIAMLGATLFFPPTPHVIERLVRSRPTPDIFVLTGFVGIILAPLEEELLFRGILLLWLRRTLGVWPAIVVSSVLFALLHSDAWPAPIPLFVLALFLGYLAQRTASLIAPVVLHATFNGVSMAVLFLSIHQGV